MSRPGEGESGRSGGFRRDSKPGGRRSDAGWRFVERRSDGGSERGDGGSVDESVASRSHFVNESRESEFRSSSSSYREIYRV